MRLGQGHASCAGDACHTRREPTLARCDGCHRLGVLPERDDARVSRRWSVAARFEHAAHAHDPTGQPVACESCHAGVLAARNVAEIPVPRKAACAGCHDGVLAFKMTGHACGRCHAHPASDAPP
jgi:c(7)-type cytochrome triheme protein